MLDAVKMGESFQDELRKIAEAKTAAPIPRRSNALPMLAAGAIGWETLRRANQDRKLGRQIRKQQGTF